MTEITPAAFQAAPPADPRLAELRKAAQKLEAAFIDEMLKAAKIGEPRDGFGGGGIGEAQFSSFLRSEYAAKLSDAGGLGLAERLFQSLVRTQNAQ